MIRGAVIGCFVVIATKAGYYRCCQEAVSPHKQHNTGTGA